MFPYLAGLDFRLGGHEPQPDELGGLGHDGILLHAIHRCEHEGERDNTVTSVPGDRDDSLALRVVCNKLQVQALMTVDGSYLARNPPSTHPGYRRSRHRRIRRRRHSNVVAGPLHESLVSLLAS